MRLGVNEDGTLFNRASKAFGWNFASTVFGKFALTGFGILLARILGPHQFGTAAVALVALLAVTSFNDLGVSLAIVRWPDEPSKIAPTVVTISVLSSVVMYIGLFLGAPAFASALGAPAASSVIRILALSVITNGIVAVPAALLERYFRQDRKTIADWVHSLSGIGISVGLAWAGYGAMSIAIGQVVGAVAGGIVIGIFAPLPLRFGFEPAQARKLVKFGLPLAGSAFIVFLVGNVDNLLAGHILGATALGLYVLAWNLASLPVNLFCQPVRNVAPALFSRLQHDPAAMRTSFTSAMTLLSAVTLPVCLLIAGSAVPLISFVYGPKWAAAAHALVWLALLSALRVIFELAYDYFVVLAKSRAVFTAQLVYLVILVPAVIAGARIAGIRGVAIAGIAVAGAVVLPWYLAELSRTGVLVRVLARRMWLPFIVALLVGSVAFAAAKKISDDFAACAISGVVALVAIGLLLYRLRPAVAELRSASLASSVGDPGPAAEEVAAGSGEAIAQAPRARAAAEAAYAARQRAALQMLFEIALTASPAEAVTGPIYVSHSVPGVPVYEGAGAVSGWQAPARDRQRYQSRQDRPVGQAPRASNAQVAAPFSTQGGNADPDGHGHAGRHSRHSGN
jgi:PST family polysaccharide transporter